MRALLYVPLAMAAALALVAAAVFGLGDRRMLVPPPEAVVEGFVRELETGRYGRATGYLSAELQSEVKPEQLKVWTSRLLERVGDVIDVSGEPGWLAGSRAEAYARLKTERAGEPALRFALSREEGVWKINGLASLRDAEFTAWGLTRRLENPRAELRPTPHVEYDARRPVVRNAAPAVGVRAAEPWRPVLPPHPVAGGERPGGLRLPRRQPLVAVETLGKTARPPEPRSPAASFAL